MLVRMRALVPEDLNGHSRRASVDKIVRAAIKVATATFETRGAVSPATLATLAGHTRPVVLDQS
jgi:hypothetical protein